MKNEILKIEISIAGQKLSLTPEEALELREILKTIYPEPLPPAVTAWASSNNEQRRPPATQHKQQKQT